MYKPLSTISLCLLISLAPLSLLGFSQNASAKTVYVSDEFFVPMRSGAGNKFRIIRNLKTGQAMEVIGGTGDNEWVNVKIGNTEGWVPQQYVMNRPTKEGALQRALSTNERLSSENALLKEQIQNLSGDKSALDTNLSERKQALETLQQEHAKLQKLSAGAVEIDRNYRELLVNFQDLETRHSVIENENSALRNDQRTTFMIYGVGFVLLGILLALILPMFKSKPRHSEWK